MGTRGRKPKYNDYIKPNLDKIKNWAAAGATESEICSALGISRATFCKYKNENIELMDAIRAGRQNVVLNIKAALYKRAIGFEYEEKVGRNSEKNGVSTEIYQRYSPPDTTAAAMLLRNYDPTYKDKDKQTADFKAQELEIKKALAESNNFDVDFTKGKK